MAKKEGLTARQWAFVREYIVDLNGTQAALRAGYSPKVARVHAARMMTDDNILAEIDRLKTRRADKLELTAEKVLAEIMRLAFTDIGQAFTPEGALKPLHEMPEDVRRAISAVEVDELVVDGAAIGRTKKIRFWDKRGSLELLGKHLKLFTERLELEDGSGLADRIASARRRTQRPKED